MIDLMLKNMKFYIHLIFILGPGVLLSFCGTVQPVEFEHCYDNEYADVVDLSVANRGNLLYLLIQNRNHLDPAGEWIEEGRIMASRIPQIRDRRIFDISGRDEFPFHPLAIDSLRQGENETIYIINRSYGNYSQIEEYSLSADRLVFRRRYRNHFLYNAYDLAVAEEGIYILTGPGYRKRYGNPFHYLSDQMTRRGVLIFYSFSTGSYHTVLTGVRQNSRVITDSNGHRLAVLQKNRIVEREIRIGGYPGSVIRNVSPRGNIGDIAYDQDSLYAIGDRLKRFPDGRRRALQAFRIDGNSIVELIRSPAIPQIKHMDIRNEQMILMDRTGVMYSCSGF